MLQEFEKQFLTWQQDILDNDDNDDVLFASSYLQGLFSTILYEYSEDIEKQILIERMNDLMIEHKNELSPSDLINVKKYWEFFQKVYL